MTLVVKDVDQMYKEQEEKETKNESATVESYRATVKGVMFLNVRDKPNGTKKDAIKEGTVVTLYENDGPWGRITYNENSSGWVMIDYLDIER